MLEKNLKYTWLGSASAGSIVTDTEKCYGEVNFNVSDSIQECGSLYTWLAGESDQESVVGTNVSIQNSSTSQSISYYVESLQNIYLESDSLIDMSSQYNSEYNL